MRGDEALEKDGGGAGDDGRRNAARQCLVSIGIRPGLRDVTTLGETVAVKYPTVEGYHFIRFMSKSINPRKTWEAEA